MTTSLLLLLEEGQKIIREREAAQEADRQAERTRTLSVFETARAKAIALFAGVDEPMVEPVLPGAEFRPQLDTEFFIRPFQASRIYVRLSGCHHEDKDQKFDWWEWRQKDSRVTFYVEYQFRPMGSDETDDAIGAFGELFHTTNSLAEAVALCERETVPFQQCIERKRKQLKRIAERAADPEPDISPEDALLAALRNWHDSLLSPVYLENP